MTATADTLAASYRALTEGCGLVDRSERGKLALTGPDAKSFLHGQVTNDIEGLVPGRGCYAAFLTHKGKMLGDLRVLDLGDELLLDTERSRLQELFNMIRRYKLGSDVELHKRTVEMGLLSLIGPDARRVVGTHALGTAEHDNARTEVGSRPVVLVTTDAGVDVFTAADDVPAVRAALESTGAVTTGEAVAEIVRVERGRPRYGFELDDGIRNSVKFLNVNLIDEKQVRAIRDVDVIFCRNVLIYFDDKSKRKAVSLMYDALAPDGVLLVGTSESLHSVTRALKPTVVDKVVIYQKAGS